MSKYHLFAHNARNFVKEGDIVKKYKTKIGAIGTANGSYWAHLHHSISEGLTVPQLRAYINGWSKNKVLKYYFNPSKTVDYEKMFGRKMDVGNAGYGWLQPIANGSPHPGIDINGKGGGNTDIGYEYTSSCDGKVIYVSETKKKDGWGKMVVVEESDSKEEKDPEPVQVPIPPKNSVEVQNEPSSTTPATQPNEQSTTPNPTDPSEASTTGITYDKPTGTITEMKEQDLGVIQKWFDDLIEWLIKILKI